MKKWFTAETKFWKVMKICGVQSAIAMVLVGVSLAHEGKSQLLETKVTLDLKEVTLETALKQISNFAKVQFIYSDDQLDLKEVVSLKADDQALGDLLEDLLTPRRVKYKVHEKESAITLRGHPKEKDNRASQLEPKLKGLPETITGTVTGSNPAEPLVGVNVIIKGTTVGTTTDADGKFAIQAGEKDIIVFSFIGYVSFETQVSGRTLIDVVLLEDTKNLNEVVVNAGYWTVKDKEQTGNIAIINADEIKTQPVSNALQAMSGRMAGVLVTQETGVAGGGIQVQIRGKNSISNGNNPLYIIDGMPVISTSLKSQYFGASLGSGSPFSTINPADIQSIEVLKDGAATSIYGSRGANGVILITTKRGQAGKTKFTLDMSSGVSNVTNMMSVLKTQDYLTMRKEAYKNENRVTTQANGYDLLLWDSTRNTNWQKELIGNTGRTTNLNASISGGDKNTQFIFSMGYYNESTVFPGDFGFKRGTGSFGLNHRSSNEKFGISLSVNYQLESNKLLNEDLTNQALLISPNAPEPYINGKLNWGPLDRFSNPYALLLNKYNVKTNNFRSNALIDYTILPGLRVKANLGYTQIQTDSYSSVAIASISPRFGVTTGQANFGTGSNASWIVEPQIDYRKVLAQSSISVLFGATFQESTRNTNTIRGTGYSNDQLLDNLQAATSISILEASSTNYRYNAVFGRFNYTLREKYIFDVIGRRDGSSRFGPDKRFANFGSISSGWIFSKEDFINRNFRFLSFGKLRASYGVSGNDQIGDYGYLDTYSTASVPYQGGTPLSPTRLANPNYSWEVNRKMEGGLELGIFEDKLFLTLSYYRNRSSNQLVGQPLSGVTGFSTVQANLAATVENSGWEIELSSVNLRRGDFSWTSNFNLTIPRNRLVSFPNLETSAYANRYLIGQPITIDKVYNYSGVDPQTGVYQFLDVDGNLSITSPIDDQTIINTGPKFFGGIGNSIQYKNWTLNFFFQVVSQKGSSYLQSFDMPGFLRNQPQDVIERWRNPGDTKPIQRFSMTSASTAYPAFQNAIHSELNYVDASFIRLKNVSFSYQLPKRWTEKVKMKGTQIFILGQNLLTFTNYSGLDPETRSFITLPPLRTITVGLSITL